jgi:crotonobetainyl-CoA:carnitine CoA-transferase CaiB-like acyl-CoA transferase
MAGPLEGVRILDLTTFTQGGEATGFLHDLGAEVIKVENRDGGDPGRRLTLTPEGVSTFFLPQNRGKRSVTIDIRAPDGRALLLRLAERCDALVHNFRPGVMERLGLGYEDMRTINPALVYAEGSGFGSAGPEAHLPAVDIVGQARGGLVSVTGDDTPVPAGAIIADYTGAMHLAIGVLSALIARIRTGRGQRVEGSMLGSMISLQGWEFTHYLITGETSRRGGRGHPLFPGLWGIYDTADGAIAIAGVAPDAWAGFAALLECPALVTDERFADAEQRRTHGSALVALVRAACRTKPTADLLARLVRLGVRCAAVQDYEQLAADPQAAANGYIVAVEHPRLGPVRMAGNPLRLSDTPIEIAAAAPELGEDTDAVLAWLGLDEDAIADLRGRGIV